MWPEHQGSPRPDLPHVPTLILFGPCAVTGFRPGSATSTIDHQLVRHIAIYLFLWSVGLHQIMQVSVYCLLENDTSLLNLQPIIRPTIDLGISGSDDKPNPW